MSQKQMECINECRFNTKLGDDAPKAPCEKCRDFLRLHRKPKTKNRGDHQKRPQKPCNSCGTPSIKRTNGMCDECVKKTTEQQRASSQQVLFVMQFDENGDAVNYRGFNTLDNQSLLQKYLTDCIGGLKNFDEITNVCTLDVHRVYNTGGSPLDANNVYIPVLKDCKSSTLRVLISFMNAESWNLRVNVQRYAETAFKAGAIDLAILVFQKTDKKVVLPEKDVKLQKYIHGTKAGIVEMIRRVFKSPSDIKVGLADDDPINNCPSAKATFNNDDLVLVVPKIDGKSLRDWKKKPDELEKVRNMVCSYIKSF